MGDKRQSHPDHLVLKLNVPGGPLGSWSFILIYARLNSFSKLLFLYVIQINSVVAMSCWFKDS